MCHWIIEISDRVVGVVGLLRVEVGHRVVRACAERVVHLIRRRQLSRRRGLRSLAVRRVERVQTVAHCGGERFGVARRAEVQPVHLLLVAPLVERWSGLIVLERTQHWTVEHNRVIRRAAPADDPVAAGGRVQEDLHARGNDRLRAAVGRRRTSRHPLLRALFEQHHGRLDGYQRLLHPNAINTLNIDH